MRRLVFFLLLIIVQPSIAGWALINNASSVNYFGSKKKIIEVNSFSNMDGSISDQGKFALSIDLSSIETNNSRRNILIQDLFFETRNFQEAFLSFDLGNNFLSNKQYNKAVKISVSATFMLNGVDQKVNIPLILIRLKNDFVLIKTFEPILLTLTDYNFSSGLERLRKEESFDNITSQVPVSLNLFFNRNDL